MMLQRLTTWLAAKQDVTSAAGGDQGIYADDRGATGLEWALLLVVMAIPAYFLFSLALAIMIEHYKMLTTLNALPLP